MLNIGIQAQITMRITIAEVASNRLATLAYYHLVNWLTLSFWPNA